MPAGENSLGIYIYICVGPDFTPSDPPHAQATVVCESAQIYYNPKPFSHTRYLFRFKRFASARDAVRFSELTPYVVYAYNKGGLTYYGAGTHRMQESRTIADRKKRFQWK